MKNNMENLDQLESLIKRFYVFLEFYSRKIVNNNDDIIINQLKDVFEKAYKKKDIKQLKKLNKELDVWIIEMRPDEKEELSRLLKEKLGEDKEQADLKRIEKINKIVNRGKISTNDEYEMILRRVDEICSDKEKSEEVMKLNKLLAEFQI